MAATTAWVLVLGLWIVGLAGLRGDWKRLFPPATGSNEQLNDWFREAQTLYLRGHWIEAEALAARILARQDGDVEARLLLASIQRRSGQRPTAARTLKDLAQHPAAAQWRDEIATEQKQLSEQESMTAAPLAADDVRNTYRKAA
jgi:hypothetical protein